MTAANQIHGNNLRNTRVVAVALMLAVGIGAGSGCADKTGGTVLGVLAGAAAGAAIGGAAGGSDGAIIGAVAGAAVGGIAGYALSGKKETQKKPEAQVREEMKADPSTTTVAAPLGANIVEIREVAVSPSTVAAGQKANLQIGMRAVGDGKAIMYPPGADVSIYNGDSLLHTEQISTETTGDVDVSVDLPIPEEAEAGTYRVVVMAKPDARVPNPQPVNSSLESTFEVVTATAKAPKKDSTAIAMTPKR